jgi:hypothetical protein
MSQPPLPSRSADDLQFSTAEPAAADGVDVSAGQDCVVCKQPIHSTYFAVGDKILCPACCELVTAPPTGSGLGRFLKAACLGFGAGLLGAILWFAIRRMANLEIGLIAILVGLMVGMAVRRGSGGRGGRRYQVLAVVITYCCIAVNYMPDIFEALVAAAREQEQAAAAERANGAAPTGTGAAAETPAKADSPDETANNQSPELADGPVSFWEGLSALVLLFVLVFGLSLAAPFLAGVQNLIGLLIISFALWEAWRFTASQSLPISGPYQTAPRSA